MSKKRQVLIIYYSFSSQTKNLIEAIQLGLGHQIEVIIERVQPRTSLRFPVGNFLSTLVMMVTTLFRRRTPILPLKNHEQLAPDLVILAGPTWSYNPSGPILSLLDQQGAQLFQGRRVLPLISCRGYWRLHWWSLEKSLRKLGATPNNLIVFSHPNPEPWRTIGVFLKLAGKVPEKNAFTNRFYQKYGHTKPQLCEATQFGKMIGQCLEEERDLSSLDFKTPIALP